MHNVHETASRLDSTITRVFDAVTAAALAFANFLFKLAHLVPGFATIIEFIERSAKEESARSLLELCLLVVVLSYVVAPRRRAQKSSDVVLTDHEIDQMVSEWTPEPLVGPITEWEKIQLGNIPVLKSANQNGRVRLMDGESVTNLASLDHLGLATRSDLISSAESTMRAYGVGPCSAPMFVGTLDVHFDLEKAIRETLKTEAALLYSQAWVTISSAIPVFCKRGDIIVADKSVNLAIRRGMQASRSRIYWFNHNDLEDLEDVLAKIIREEKGKRLTRRFVITEGIFEYGGGMVNLPRLVDIKNKYKFRLVLDESLSFGVMGRTGKGLTEHFAVPVTQVELIVGSMAGILCSGGGFCAGSKEIVEIQRLTSAAACFSASLPAFLATTAILTMRLLQMETNHLHALRGQVIIFRTEFQTSKWMHCSSAPENPIILLELNARTVDQRQLSWERQHYFWEECVNEVSLAVLGHCIDSPANGVGSAVRKEF
ncbi:hypothetical protein CBER1_11210 [Cercospora berteroae]|uniref:serine C-palmitoyltransferase n=1 Tax=Cercospora berteroae TaxID=357750 RepID=A0A2S6CMB6_9PEZI|nr:hypothetical protein CBER1_11210 [Cercospora berteroae]